MENKITEFFEKAQGETKALAAWVNTHTILDDEQMDILKDNLIELGCRALVVAVNVPPLAPNETHGILPERFVKLNNIKEEEDTKNTFVFAILRTALYDLSRFDELMHTLPECHYNTFFPFEFE